LKHRLVDSVFDADSEYVIKFDTDRNLLMETAGRKSKTDGSTKVCLGVSQVANVFCVWKMYDFVAHCQGYKKRNDEKLIYIDFNCVFVSMFLAEIFTGYTTEQGESTSMVFYTNHLFKEQ